MSCYALVDPRTEAVRYVGRARNPHARLKVHLARPHSKRLAHWINDLAELHAEPRLRVLDGRTEREWISDLKPDLNVAEGDDTDSPAVGHMPRERYQLDLPADARDRWEKAAGKTLQPLASFIRSAVEEKIRRDGLA